MSNVDVTLADIEAIGDVVTWVAEQSEDMGLAAAIEMAEALAQLSTLIGKTKSLCEARAKKLMDGQPQKIGDKVYIEKATGKWRPDQSKIRRRVAVMSSCDENGEMLPSRDAAEKAVDLMYALFVSPLTMPKQGGMKQLGLEAKDVAEWERTGSELKVIATEQEDR